MFIISIFRTWSIFRPIPWSVPWPVSRSITGGAALLIVTSFVIAIFMSIWWATWRTWGRTTMIFAWIIASFFLICVRINDKINLFQKFFVNKKSKGVILIATKILLQKFTYITIVYCYISKISKKFSYFSFTN